MSSPESEMPSLTTPGEQTQTQNRSFTAFFPFIMGFTAAAQPPQNEGNGENRAPIVPEGFVIMNPSTYSMVMIPGPAANLEALFCQMTPKNGPLPASEASIEAMPVVKVTEEGSDCPICLAEYEVGGEAKEMPCKHWFHPGCIEKWLGINGSCPVCRYNMPVKEEEEEERKRSRGEDDAGRGSRVGEITITLTFGDLGRDQSSGDGGSCSPDGSSGPGLANDESIATGEDSSHASQRNYEQMEANDETQSSD